MFVCSVVVSFFFFSFNYFYSICLFISLFIFLRETLTSLCLRAGFLLGRQQAKMTRVVHLLNLLILSARVRGKMRWEGSRDLAVTVPREDAGYIINNAVFYFVLCCFTFSSH